MWAAEEVDAAARSLDLDVLTITENRGGRDVVQRIAAVRGQDVVEVFHRTQINGRATYDGQHGAVSVRAMTRRLSGEA